MTWFRQGEAYDLFFNRDERKTRPAALPPIVNDSGTTPFIAPTDPEAGGSWIAVNARGVTVCMLNYYEAMTTYAPEYPVSRGKLLVSLADAGGGGEIRERLKERSLKPFAPFILCVTEPGKPVLTCTWDGREYSIAPVDDDQMPITTSSFNTPAVIANRRRVLRDMQKEEDPSTALLERYHRQHDPAQGAYSVCMARDDAQTVSFTHVRVTPDKAQMNYLPGPPNRAAEESTVRISVKRLEGEAC